MRFSRFPRSFARSALNRSMRLLMEKSPSRPNVISRMRKYRRASVPISTLAPDRAARSSETLVGAIALPFDLDIFCPSMLQKPCPNIFLGKVKAERH